jgi:hypothetical protein
MGRPETAPGGRQPHPGAYETNRSSFIPTPHVPRNLWLRWLARRRRRTLTCTVAHPRRAPRRTQCRRLGHSDESVPWRAACHSRGRSQALPRSLTTGGRQR